MKSGRRPVSAGGWADGKESRSLEAGGAGEEGPEEDRLPQSETTNVCRGHRGKEQNVKQKPVCYPNPLYLPDL